MFQHQRNKLQSQIVHNLRVGPHVGLRNTIKPIDLQHNIMFLVRRSSSMNRLTDVLWMTSCKMWGMKFFVKSIIIASITSPLHHCMRLKRSSTKRTRMNYYIIIVYISLWEVEHRLTIQRGCLTDSHQPYTCARLDHEVECRFFDPRFLIAYLLNHENSATAPLQCKHWMYVLSKDKKNLNRNQCI